MLWCGTIWADGMLPVVIDVDKSKASYSEGMPVSLRTLRSSRKEQRAQKNSHSLIVFLEPVTYSRTQTELFMSG